ncbi:MAG: tRNA-dihydrouridine synthase family protein [Kiritimatiellae bacterium]|nr:tRNA-dihydrouridine synthase family protein [Kiritimatiellia bacterium]
MNSLRIGDLDLESPVLMAPMAGYADLAFRRCLRSLGGLGLAFTAMLNPVSLIRGTGRERNALLATHPEDQPLGYQLYGKDPDWVARAARWLEERGARLVDINMGCPQKRISGKGCGAGLLKEPDLAIRIVRKVLEQVTVPVTAKLRLGWDNAETAVHLARAFESEGVAAVTVHGRTRVQGFSGRVDLDAIRRVVEATDKIPVIANGDIDSVAAAREMFAHTGCAGVMLGRYALKNPWLIRDIARDLRGDPPLPPPTAEEREAFMRRHYELSVELYGDRAEILFRKWLPLYGIKIRGNH